MTRIYLTSAAPQASACGEDGRASRTQQKIGDTLADLKRAYPPDGIELWTQDEARC